MDRLLENAPESLPEEEEVQPPQPVVKAESETNKTKEEAVESLAETQRKIQEDFYKDPLIQDALAVFEGKLIQNG